MISEQNEMNSVLASQRSTNNELSTLEDNAPYNIGALFTNPQVILDNNYSSYGLSLNLLTPLGSLNASYGMAVSTLPQ